LGLWTSVSLTAAKFKPLNAVCVRLRIDPYYERFHSHDFIRLLAT
jgi:hypothetical protein